MSKLPASRIDRVKPPATVAAGERARELVRQGKEVIDLGQSSPHQTTPSHIIEAGVEALRKGLTNISSVRGIPEFLDAMATKLRTHNNLQVDPGSEVLVTPGSKQGLYDVINAYVEPGDEVLLVEPTWVSFREQVELAGGTPVAVALSEEEEYTLSYEVLERHVTPRTKAIVINNPNNPTGRVYTQRELEDVVRFIQEHDLLAICDETYEYFTHDSTTHITLATLPGMWERTLTSFTFTKAYAMAGWRLGCIVGQASLVEPVVRVHEHTSSFVSPFVQMAGVAALNGPQGHLEAWTQEVEQLRRRATDRLNQVPGVYCRLPQGATFLFPRYSGRCSSVELSQMLVERESVVVTPGSGFGECGEGHIRIALMRSPADRVIEGVERIARLLETL
ncbi:MAG: pyridoxal phosphate-dependent aminotransferase [Dehalococcoidia bacterium]